MGSKSIKLMEKLDSVIDWSSIEDILMSHHTVVGSTEGARAYPPIVLFKCLLLQKWFRPREISFAFHEVNIPSNPELENQNCTVYSHHTKNPIEKSLHG